MDQQQHYALVVGRPLAPTLAILQTTGLSLLVFGGVGAAIAAAIGYVIAKSGLQPIRKLTDAVLSIAATNKLTPVEIHGDDEIAEVSLAAGAEVFVPHAADVGLVFEGHHVVDEAGHGGVVEAPGAEGVPDGLRVFLAQAAGGFEAAGDHQEHAALHVHVLALGAGDALPLFGAGLVVVGDLADGVAVEEEQAGEAVLVAVDLGGGVFA